MRTILDDKCLASWAVFKRFGENNHKDRYEVLREFIKATIYKHSLRTFTISSLTDIVNEDYAFNLKAAVVAYAIQQLQLNTDSFGQITCNPDDYIEQKAVINEIEKEKTESDKVIDLLFNYVEGKRGEKLIPSEKEELVQSFINYILDNSYSDKFAPEISSYVITYKAGNPLSLSLDSILEGVVSYTGVTYDTPASASSRWTTDMYVYLDTEILFHMAGYNGILYKQLFDDFYSFVEEINKDCAERGGGKRIYLRYFPETEDEVNNFFERAKDIVNNKIRIIPYVTAMKAITTGCNSDSDIDEKRGLFESLLNRHGILKDTNPVDYYKDSQYALNIEDQRIIDDFVRENKKFKPKDVANALASLSHVNVLRKGKSNRSFENLKFVLLTDNFITKRLSRNPEIRKDGDRLLSTDLYFITNRMWNRLGKAFGDSETPKVFDVICKAKIILASQINNSVASKYDELVHRMDSGEISPDDAIEVLYQLRSEVKNPEELDDKDDVDDAWAAFTEAEISKYAERRDYQEQHQRKIQEENENLRKEIVQIKERETAAKKENEDFRHKIVQVTEENKRIEKVNLELSIQADETSKQIKELSNSLAESKKRENYIMDSFYKRELKSFIDKRKRQAWGNLIIILLLIVIIITLEWLTDKYQWYFMAHWIQRLLTYIVPLLVYIFRAYVTKIDPVRMIKIICGKDNANIEKEFKKEWSECD